MSDLPPGQWSPLLVGLYWPGADSVMSAINAARNRGSLQLSFDDFSRQLFGVRTGPLAPMEGVTADAVRDLFEKGEKHATAVSDKNGAKQSAFGATADALNGLRSALSQIAAEGNSKIDEINKSKKNIAQKVAEIVQVISEKQAEAANKSTQFGGAITKAISDVLTAEGDPRSAQQFAADSGFDLSNPPVPQSKDTLRGLVEPLVKGPPSDSTQAVINGSKGAVPEATMPASSENTSTQSVVQSTNSFSPAGSVAQNSPADTSHVVGSPVGPQSVPGVITTPAASTDIKLPGGTSLPGVPIGPGGGIALPGSGGGIPTGGLPGLPSVPTTGIGSGLPDVGQALAPQNLAQGFTQGMQAGGPISAGAEHLSQAISQGTQNAIHAPMFQPTEFSTPAGTLSAATSPSSGSAMAFEQAYTPAQAVSATPLSPTMFSPPAPMSAAPVAATPPPVVSGGPLPAYGADLRAATPTVSAPPPLAAPTTAPTSAPISATNTSSGLTQSVVGKAPASAAPVNAPPIGVTESALAATASGAAAGATAAQSEARARLRRFVEAVARQEPRLRWAIGDREDGATILVTDLYSGWIPPGIEIPTGVTLLSPEARHGSFEKLLRDAAIIETWSPGQFLPLDEDAEPVAMSLRARDLPTVDDLNWEITQATNWRDGLPRLAHTLTKAVVGGTGVLDTETDLLREHLRAISDEVHSAYPDSVDPQAVGTWQLLAAIDALVSGKKTALNYHFAWFKALHTAQQGR